MTEESANGPLQTLKQNSRATSKFRRLEPTLLKFLVEHAGYTAPKPEDLESLSEGDLVKVAFINNTDLWIAVDSVDGDAEAGGVVYGKTCENAMKELGIQKGQRVCFDIQCICQIKFHDSDDSDEDDD